MSTSEVLENTANHQYWISMNGIPRIMGEIIKVILEPVVRFPLYKRWEDKDCR